MEQQKKVSKIMQTFDKRDTAVAPKEQADEFKGYSVIGVMARKWCVT